MHVRSCIEISMYLCFCAISATILHKRFFAQRIFFTILQLEKSKIVREQKYRHKARIEDLSYREWQFSIPHLSRPLNTSYFVHISSLELLFEPFIL